MTTSKKVSPIIQAYGTLKSIASKAAGKIAGNTREVTMRFYLDSCIWYADIPAWPGPKGMLAMVDGADAFLEYLTENGTEITLDISVDKKPGYRVLDYLEPHPANDGAYYMAKMDGRMHRLWLCGVTEFVFGQMPPEVWFKVNESEGF